METGVNWRQSLPSFIGLVVVIGGLYAVFRYFGITEVQTAVENAGIWAPLVLILAKAATIVIAPLGGSPLYPLAGALFGFWKGGILLVLGDALGGAIAFYLARFLGRHIVEKMLGEESTLWKRALKMMGTVKGFLVARVCFAPLPEIAAYGAGLTRLNFVPFILIYTVVGAVPAFALAGVGSLLTLGVWWMLPVALVAGTILIPLGFLLFRSLLKEWEETH